VGRREAESSEQFEHGALQDVAAPAAPPVSLGVARWYVSTREGLAPSFPAGMEGG
jgi:hypothetical protein